MFSEFLSLANRTYVPHIQKEIRISCQIGYDVLFVRSNKLPQIRTGRKCNEKIKLHTWKNTLANYKGKLHKWYECLWFDAIDNNFQIIYQSSQPFSLNHLSNDR